jgi:hypothetical protein
MPAMIDIAKSVIFVFHPREGDDFAKVVIRPRFGRQAQRRVEGRGEAIDAEQKD